MDHELRKYLAAIGRKGGEKGGKTKGAAKRRSPEHYERLAAMKRSPFKVCHKCFRLIVISHDPDCPANPR
jgi:hypothetical protein